MTGTVAGLWRYPVKSMDGARLDRCDVTPQGIPGDRAWALMDRATGKPMSGKRFAKLMLCSAAFVDEVDPKKVPPAEITFPEGERIRTDASNAAAVLTRYFGVDCAPVLAPGEHFDDRPLHLVSASTLAYFRGRTGLDYDVRRFRPNVLVEVPGTALIEKTWVGRSLRVGAVEVAIAKETKRCVMTTLPQPGLPLERGILENVVHAGNCLGVYGAATAQGAFHAGDAVLA